MVLSLDDAVHALEAAVITLTGLNAIAAASVLVLVWLDNRSHRTKSTPLSRKLRLPLYLAITILLGQIIFIIRETLELGVINSDKIQSCTVMSEFTWFGKRPCSRNRLTQSNLATDCRNDTPGLCGSRRYSVQSINFTTNESANAFSMTFIRRVVRLYIVPLQFLRPFSFGCHRIYWRLRPAIPS